LGGRPAAEARPAEDDRLRALPLYPVAVADLKQARARARHKRRLAGQEIVEVEGVEAVGVLLGRDGIDGGVLVEPGRQRKLEEDAVDRGIAVDLVQRGEELVLGTALREQEVARADADLV